MGISTSTHAVPSLCRWHDGRRGHVLPDPGQVPFRPRDSPSRTPVADNPQLAGAIRTRNFLLNTEAAGRIEEGFASFGPAGHPALRRHHPRRPRISGRRHRRHLPDLHVRHDGRSGHRVLHEGDPPPQGALRSRGRLRSRHRRRHRGASPDRPLSARRNLLRQPTPQTAPLNSPRPGRPRPAWTASAHGTDDRGAAS